MATSKKVEAESTSAKEAKRIISLEDVKFNKDNALLAAVACIPGIALVMFFVEKKDLFVRYMAAQYTLLSLLYLVTWIPVVGWLVPLFMLIMTIMGALKSYKGERWDLPVVSKIAIDLINKF